MIPLGIRLRSGGPGGPRNWPQAIPKAQPDRDGTGLGLGAIVMSISAFVLLVFPEAIARVFTPDVEIIADGAALLRVAAFFQLFDGLQVVATGALRGAGDTRTPMFCHFTGYWVIGLPVGAVLCFHYGLGAQGLWMGLSGGLILIGIVLVVMWRHAVGKLRATIGDHELSDD